MRGLKVPPFFAYDYNIPGRNITLFVPDPIDGKDSSLRWQASISDAKEMATDETIKKLFPSAVTIKVGGILADMAKNGNGWALESSAIDEVVNDINAGKVDFRLDHSKETKGVIGKMTKAERVGSQIKYEAEMMTANPDVAIPVLKGYVKGVSMSAKPKSVGCSVCKKDGPISCSCKGGHLSVRSLGMVESSVTPDPAYSEGRATLAPLSFSAAMDQLAASMSVNKMGDNDKKEPTVDELKAMLEKQGYQVTKPDPLAEAKAKVEAQTKELEAMKAEMEKLKAGQTAAPPPSSAPGKPAAKAPDANAGQEKKEELTLEAMRKQSPIECAMEALKAAKAAKGNPEWERIYG